jgi:dTMP kinase
MGMTTFSGMAPPGVDTECLGGTLVVIEGPDASGRSTQIGLLRRWLEQSGYPVAETGLKRSQLVGRDLERAKQGNVLSPRTLSLFYATDFYDQLENRIIPALRAGSVVLADRYIFTLMARDIVRGADPAWVESLYSLALVPHAVYYLVVSPEALLERTLTKHGSLDYWESGMDLGLSRDWLTSYLKFQRNMRSRFRALRRRYGFEAIGANRPVDAIHRGLRTRIAGVLARRYPAAPPSGGDDVATHQTGNGRQAPAQEGIRPWHSDSSSRIREPRD